MEKAIEAESPAVRLPYFGHVKDDFPPKFLLMKLKNEMWRGVENLGREVRSAMIEVCQNCGKGGKVALLQCSRCKKAKYCDKKCQKENWKEHKKNCFY